MRTDNDLLHHLSDQPVPAWRDWLGAAALWALYVVLLAVLP